jgi:hypothetical protein
VFRPKKTLKETRIKLYNTLALPTVLYGNENWIIKARDTRRITLGQMKYMRTAGYTSTDHKYRDCKRIKYKPSFRQNT